MASHTPRHLEPSRKKRPRSPKLPLLLAAAAVVVCAIALPSIGAPASPGPSSSTSSPQAAATPTPTPEPTPAPTPTPTPTPEPVYDFSQAAPASDPVDMDYFADALFIGDSRTDGLQLYSGIKGATFYCYKGLTVFELQDRKVVELDGGTYSVAEALGRRQYAKVYISLGINELGYFNDQAFEDTFRAFLRQLRQLQPDAVIYLENLVPVNPDKCKEYKQPYYVTNEQVAVYNEIFSRLAPEEHVVLLDLASALSDETGILARENTVDGVHFTKAWYKTWLDYLMTHTVDPLEYQAGQSAPVAEEGETANEA